MPPRFRKLSVARAALLLQSATESLSDIAREEELSMPTVDTYGVWEVYPGNEMRSLALPDYLSIYLSYSLDISKYPNMGLRITGEFPNARYMSFNTYATRTGTSFGALTDFQITTPNPADNPFVAGNKPQNIQYVVNVQAAQSDAEDGPLAPPATPPPANLLSFDPAALKEGLLTIVIRYYVPQNGAGGEYGGVAPPTIAAYDMNHPDKTRDAPKPYHTRMDLNEPIFRKRLAPIFESVGGDALRFYHSVGAGQFNNADNIYLISAVKNVDGRDNVVILKVKPPTYPRTSDEFDQAIVRYWSFNQGDPDTSTPFGMKDADFRPAKDGFVYIVMGDDSFSDKAREGGYNHMPWKANKEEAVILYRNMLTIPQYRGSIARVAELPKAQQRPRPAWDERTLVEYEAHNYIHDYAPVGRKVTAREFHDSFGGLRSPGFA